MGQYDRAIKLLVDTNPEAMARFVLQEWQKQTKKYLPDLSIAAVKQLSTDFQEENLEGDGAYLLEGPEGPLYLMQAEYQSRLDPMMPLRSLEYLARMKKKHWKICGHLPVIAVVFYLFKSEDILSSPLRWPGPLETTSLYFNYLVINMQDVPREEILALQEPELWPLVLLTKGNVDRILVEEMFGDLLERKLYRTLPIGQVIASWFLHGDDLIWLYKEYQKMFDIFQDAPAIQWIEESITEKLTKELTEKLTRELTEKFQKQTEQQLRAERQKAEQQLRTERQRTRSEQQKHLRGLQHMAVEMVSQRFPSLTRLARAQAQVQKNPDSLQQAILKLGTVNTSEEAQDVLLALSEITAEEQNSEQEV
ncbi:MAG TPA: hypothetical protein VHD63_00395 [Ktedonobacteraceae bacterium]|nr:hypothetical protein [Ktedonobacteraceae bacterium]